MIDPLLSEDATPVTAKTLRQFAVLTIVIFGGAAAWHGFSRGIRPFDIILIAAAVIIGPLGLIRPESIRPVFTTLIFVTAPMGRVMTWLVLAVLFYGVFTPLGLAMRVLGRDALHVRRPTRPSHWTTKATAVDVRDYTRQ
jgi:hypothetical protein